MGLPVHSAIVRKRPYVSKAFQTVMIGLVPHRKSTWLSQQSGTGD